jgi:hypothetical protein
VAQQALLDLEAHYFLVVVAIPAAMHMVAVAVLAVVLGLLTVRLPQTKGDILEATVKPILVRQDPGN